MIMQHCKPKSSGFIQLPLKCGIVRTHVNQRWTYAKKDSGEYEIVYQNIILNISESDFNEQFVKEGEKHD